MLTQTRRDGKYVKGLRKLALEIGTAEKQRKLFMNCFNGELQMYLLPEKPITYNKALREARAKDLVKKNNTGLQLPANIMKTLDEIRANHNQKESRPVNVVHQFQIIDHVVDMR